MADRVFRDEILSSPRYWGLASDTHRMLFYHLGFMADDFGIFRAANYTVRKECFGADSMPAPEVVAKLLNDLADADLIRLYRSSDDRDFGFIPRWKQRLRTSKSSFPMPPVELRDNSINELIEKMSGICPTDVGHLSPERKGKERKGNEKEPTRAIAVPVDNSAAVAARPASSQAISGKWWADVETMKTFGNSIGVIAAPGESRDNLYKRIRAKLAEIKTGV